MQNGSVGTGLFLQPGAGSGTRGCEVCLSDAIYDRGKEERGREGLMSGDGCRIGK